MNDYPKLHSNIRSLRPATVGSHMLGRPGPLGGPTFHTAGQDRAGQGSRLWQHPHPSGEARRPRSACHVATERITVRCFALCIVTSGLSSCTGTGRGVSRPTAEHTQKGLPSPVVSPCRTVARELRLISLSTVACLRRDINDAAEPMSGGCGVPRAKPDPAGCARSMTVTHSDDGFSLGLPGGARRNGAGGAGQNRSQCGRNHDPRLWLMRRSRPHHSHHFAVHIAVSFG